MGWGAGQGNGGTQAPVSVGLSVHCVCVRVCVCLGALWAVLVAMRLEGRGAWTPWPAPSRGGEHWRASVTWALMGKQLRRGHRAERHMPGGPEAPVLCPQPHLGGGPLLPGVAGKLSLPSG